MRKLWPVQVLCCLNIALVLVSDLEQKGGSPSLSRLLYPIYIYVIPPLRKSSGNAYLERDVLLYVKSLLVAALFFLGIRMLAHFRPLTPVTVTLTGIFSVAAYPIGFLWFRWQWVRVPSAEVSGVVLETIAIVALLIIYLYAKSLLPQRVLFVLLISHFTLWGWVSGNLGVLFAAARDPSYPGSWAIMIKALLLPTIGLLASIVWVIQVRTPNGLTRSMGGSY